MNLSLFLIDAFYRLLFVFSVRYRAVLYCRASRATVPYCMIRCPLGTWYTTFRRVPPVRASQMQTQTGIIIVRASWTTPQPSGVFAAHSRVVAGTPRDPAITHGNNLDYLQYGPIASTKRCHRATLRFVQRTRFFSLRKYYQIQIQ
jgi:hypothetical protein